MTDLMKHALIALSIFAAQASVATSAHAIEVYNCTDASVPVYVTHAKSGRKLGASILAAEQSEVWKTQRRGGLKIRIKVNGKERAFRGLSRRDTLSIQTVAGNIELLDGAPCGQSSVGADAKPRGRMKRARQAVTGIVLLGLVAK